MKYSAQNNLRLKEWAVAAKVPKSITFHVARHTFATLVLTRGADIFTSQIFLVTRIKTTAIYAKIVDDKKKEARDKNEFRDMSVDFSYTKTTRGF
ncbi:MAG: hypothetical protein R2799_13875 [Crocinitomicaceae bacterium]